MMGNFAKDGSGSCHLHPMINLSISKRRQPVILYYPMWCSRKHTAYFSTIDLERETSHLTFHFILVPQQSDASPPYPLSLPAPAKITHESLRARCHWLSSILPPHWAHWLSFLDSVSSFGCLKQPQSSASSSVCSCSPAWPWYPGTPRRIWVQALSLLTPTVNSSMP